MSAPEAPAKGQQAYEFIRSHILSGRYGANARITASEIAQDAGTSVGPIREAMRRLEAEGLISYRPNIGATVITMDYAMLAATLGTLAILEGAATALAAPLLTDDDFDRLEAINDNMRAATEVGDLADASRFNRQFHHECYRRCPNPWLLELLEKTADRAYVGRRSLFFELPSRPHVSVNEHRELVEMMRSSASAETIETAVRRHKQRTLDMILEKANERP